MVNTLSGKSVYLSIKFVAKDDCEFVGHRVTLHLRINIVLPDCMTRGVGGGGTVCNSW